MCPSVLGAARYPSRPVATAGSKARGWSSVNCVRPHGHGVVLQRMLALRRMGFDMRSQKRTSPQSGIPNRGGCLRSGMGDVAAANACVSSRWRRCLLFGVRRMFALRHGLYSIATPRPPAEGRREAVRYPVGTAGRDRLSQNATSRSSRPDPARLGVAAACPPHPGSVRVTLLAPAGSRADGCGPQQAQGSRRIIRRGCSGPVGPLQGRLPSAEPGPQAQDGAQPSPTKPSCSRPKARPGCPIMMC
jgi:hypothetical protein